MRALAMCILYAFTSQHVHQGTSARAGAALINQILVLPVGQGQNLKG